MIAVVLLSILASVTSGRMDVTRDEVLGPLKSIELDYGREVRKQGLGY